MKLYIYSVMGSGPFPVDMLRYDACWPATTDDAMQIVTHIKYEDRYQAIKLFSHQAPTVARWGSFGWTVVLKR